MARNQGQISTTKRKQGHDFHYSVLFIIIKKCICKTQHDQVIKDFMVFLNFGGQKSNARPKQNIQHRIKAYELNATITRGEKYERFEWRVATIKLIQLYE